MHINSLYLKIEEMLLVILISLNVLAFFNIIPITFEFYKHILSWILIGYLFYHVSISKILFGERNKILDIGILFSYFLLIFKNIISVAIILQEEILKKGIEILKFNYTNLTNYVLSINVSDLTNLNPALFDSNTIYYIIKNLTLMSSNIIIRISDSASTLYLSVQSKSSILPLINTIANNQSLLNYYSLFIGGVSIIIISILVTIFIDIKKPSLMHILHQDNLKNDLKHYILRFITVTLSLLGFFVIVFNLFMEWLAIAIDSTIIMLLVLVYIYLFIKHKKYKNKLQRHQKEKLIFDVANSAEKFYDKIINLFQTKKGLFYGISGMLVLHLITDITVFIIPYIFGLNSLYFSSLGNNSSHLSLIDLIVSNFSFSTLVVYLLNIIGILFLLLFPVWLWYDSYKKKRLHISCELIFLLIPSILTTIFYPIFKIKDININGLYGIDIITNNPLFNFKVIWYFFIIGFLIYWLVKHHKKIHHYIDLLLCLISILFFGYYSSIFFLSVSKYFTLQISNLLYTNIFIALILLLIYIITIMFYLLGYIFYIKEVIKVRIKKGE